jgi:hypothetical protein
MIDQQYLLIIFIPRFFFTMIILEKQGEDAETYQRV